MNRIVPSIIAILAISLGYTILRYYILGPEPADRIPAFLLNKAAALASVTFLFRAAVAHWRNRPECVRDWGTAALHAGYVHILLSLALFSAAYHPAFFTDDRLSLRGEWAIGFGTLAAYGFWLIRRNRSSEPTKRALQAITSVLIVCHLFSMGSQDWLNMTAWHGGLPPISLIGFILVFASGVLFVLSPRKNTVTS